MTELTEYEKFRLVAARSKSRNVIAIADSDLANRVRVAEARERAAIASAERYWRRCMLVGFVAAVAVMGWLAVGIRYVLGLVTHS